MPSPVIVNGNIVDPVQAFTYLGCLLSRNRNSREDYIWRIGLVASTMKRLDCRPIWSQTNLSTPMKIRIYSTCSTTLWLQNVDCYTDRLENTGLLWYGSNNAFYVTAGMTLSPITKFFAVLAYLKSHSLFANEDSVFSATLPDSHTLYQPTRSFESAPRWEMARNGDVHVVVHPPPGFTRSATSRVSQRLSPCSWWQIDCSGGWLQRRMALAEGFTWRRWCWWLWTLLLCHSLCTGSPWN